MYGRLPVTTCQRRGICCGLLPPVQHIELLVWLLEFLQLPREEAALQANKLVEHFLFNAAQRRQCPWLEPGSCNIYNRRFFGCRAYGLWSPQAYEQRRSGSVEASRRTAQAWASMGVELPADILAPGPDYCLAVQPLKGHNTIDDSELDRQEDNLAAMTQDLPGSDIFTQWGGDISYAVAWLVLGPQTALEMKVQATKALLSGAMQSVGKIKAQAIMKTGKWLD